MKEKQSTATIIKKILRIIISAIIGIIIIRLYDFNSFMKLIVFFLTYIVVSLILEPIFKKIEK